MAEEEVRVFFFFNDTATTEIYTLSLHDALPICAAAVPAGPGFRGRRIRDDRAAPAHAIAPHGAAAGPGGCGHHRHGAAPGARCCGLLPRAPAACHQPRSPWRVAGSGEIGRASCRERG